MLRDQQFTAPPGWVLRHLPEVGSTNDLVREEGKRGAPEKTVIVADHQTSGRGRLDRSWLELPGSSLLFSILFRRHLSHQFLLTALCSVATCEAIERITGSLAEIKWPNDVMMSGRKLAGVLTEVNWFPGNHFAVVGIGLNVNFDPSLVEGIPDTATSLLRETGRSISRQELLYEILLQIDQFLGLDPSVAESTVRSRWASRLWRRRQRIVIAEGGALLEGVFEGVDEDGALLLRLDNGFLETVRVGDLQA